MKRDATDIVLEGSDGEIRVRRMAHGYPRVKATTDVDLYRGLGYAHGRDRQMQMWLLKLLEVAWGA